MTIDPRQTTAAFGDLGKTRAHRSTSADPRRAGAARPPSAAAPEAEQKRARAEAAAQAAARDAAQEAAREAARVAHTEFPLQELSIRRDAEIGRFVVRVVEAESGELVRQIPSEEWVRALKRLHGATGRLVDRKG